MSSVIAQFNITVFLLIVISCSGQKGPSITYWIPEKYVHGLVSHGTDDECLKQIRPIQAIANKNGEWHVQTYNGKLQSIRSRGPASAKIVAVGPLSLNLKFFSIEEQDSLKQIEYRLRLYDDSILLEAIRDSHLIEVRKYISVFNGYHLEELRKTKRILLLQGKYDVFDNRGEVIESNVEISVSGRISGSGSMDSCVVSRVGVPKEFIYDCVEFYMEGKLIKSLALIYDEKERTWKAHNYRVVDGAYTISSVSQFAFRLKKK